jgi:AraC-like DNA-binding protein
VKFFAGKNLLTSGISLRLYDITPALQPYVKLICSIESDGKNNPFHPFRVLPDTCVELFINYINTSPARISTGKSFDGGNSFVVSRMNSFMDVEQPGKTGFFSVCFYPAAARHFFSLPMNELSNNVISLDELWQNVSTQLAEEMFTAAGNDQRSLILQQFLVQQLEKNYVPDKGIEFCLWQLQLLKGQLHIGKLAEKTGISNRQLSRRFNDNVGLSPKEFARITKFIHSLSWLKKFPAHSLTEIAYESGYYDQAHYIHDCREFSGYAPGKLLTTPHMLY